MANSSGWPGTLKSGFTFTRPALSSSTPSFRVSGTAETPAAQMMFPARMNFTVGQFHFAGADVFNRGRRADLHAQALPAGVGRWWKDPADNLTARAVRPQ